MAAFKPKDLEPKLSKDIHDVIKRSTGDKTLVGTRLDDVTFYEYELMKKICLDEDVKSALMCDADLDFDDVRGKYVFDYLKLPELQDKVKNYICFTVVPNQGFAETISYQCTIRSVCYKDNIETDYGISRHKLISMILRNKLNWSNEFGLTLIRLFENDGFTDTGFYYRDITFGITSKTNGIQNKVVGVLD